LQRLSHRSGSRDEGDFSQRVAAMIDFTNLFLVFLMIFAVSANRIEIAGAIFILLLVLAKDKALILVAIVGAVIALSVLLGGGADPLIIGGGLLLVLIILLKDDGAGAGPQGYYPQG